MSHRITTALAVMTLTILAAAVRADINLALPSNDPNVQRIGFQNFGQQLSSGVNDGDTSDTFAFMSASPVLDQEGFSLNTFGNVNSVTIYQSNDTRAKIENADVYTSNNVYHFTGIADQPTITLSLDGSPTSEVLVVPTAFYTNGGGADGINEITVNASSSFSRTNWALGLPSSSITTSGGYNSGSVGGLVDGDLYSTVIFDRGGSITFDLGAVRPIGGFGIAEDIAENRQVFGSVEIDFSNDPSFSTLVGTETLALSGDPMLQQFDFSTISAEYVRVTDIGRQNAPGNTVSPDTNTGLAEFQILGPTPEPASLALLAVGGVALLRRRRA